MPIKTPLTQMLGIRHPILLAAMDLVADAKLTAAVSEAGGFGILGAGYGDKDWLARELPQLVEAKQRRNLPFGVGFITWSLARQPQLLDQALAAKPDAVWLSFGDPAPFAAKVKAAGIPLICQVQTVAMAEDAVAKGADIIVAQGGEAGGHGVARSSLTLAPAVVDAVGKESAGGAGRRRRRRARACRRPDAGRARRGARDAPLRQPGSCRPRRRQRPHRGRLRRRHPAQHRVRHIAAQCMACALHRPLPCQRHTRSAGPAARSS